MLRGRSVKMALVVPALVMALAGQSTCAYAGTARWRRRRAWLGWRQGVGRPGLGLGDRRICIPGSWSAPLYLRRPVVRETVVVGGVRIATQTDVTTSRIATDGT